MIRVEASVAVGAGNEQTGILRIYCNLRRSLSSPGRKGIRVSSHKKGGGLASSALGKSVFVRGGLILPQEGCGFAECFFVLFCCSTLFSTFIEGTNRRSKVI